MNADLSIKADLAGVLRTDILVMITRHIQGHQHKLKPAAMEPLYRWGGAARGHRSGSKIIVRVFTADDNDVKGRRASRSVTTTMKMFTHLLLFGQLFEAPMEDGTGFTGQVTGFFGFQEQGGRKGLREAKQRRRGLAPSAGDTANDSDF